MDTNGKLSIAVTVQENTLVSHVLEDRDMEAQQSTSEEMAIELNSESDKSDEDSDCHSHDEQDHGSQIILAPVLPPSEPEPKEKRFILEPAVVLMYFSTSLSGAIYQNQLLYQSCVNTFHYSEDVCEPLLGIAKATNASKAVENVVQPYVANIIMAGSLITAIIPAILSLFVGPWSDKHGRRPVILISMFGYFLSSIISIILTLIKTINPWVYVVSSVPIAITGGYCAMMTVIYCYIADVAPPQKRAIRMILNDAALGAGTALGSLLSGYILAGTNLPIVYGISAVLAALALAYVIFFAPESVVPNYVNLVSKIKDFFRYELVVDLIKTCTKRRQNAERAILWLTIVSIVVTYFVQQGAGNMTYLFLRKQFNLTLNAYNQFNGITTGIQIFGGIVGMVLLRRICKVSLIFVSMLAIGSLILQTVVSATAQKFWEMYMGSAFGFMGGIVIPLLLAIMSRITPVSEVGKVFAVTTSLQTVTPLGAAPLYTAVYDATLDYYPGLFNIVSVALYILCFGMLATIFYIQKSRGITIL